MDEYNSSIFLHAKDIKISKETELLLNRATGVYNQNFDKKTWYGRCLFLSWYCSRASCKFCFRATRNHQQKFADKYKRSIESLLLEALFCRKFNWRIEFLTGGYDIVPFEELLDIIKNIKAVYEDKIWLNLGYFNEEQLEQLKPYVEGICSSMETLNPELHKDICPDKPIEPYEEMFKKIKGFKKSIAIIVGLGDTIDDMKYLYDFIEKYDLDRITVYPLKPVPGTIFKKGPSTDEYLQWLALLRIKFPKLEIIAGTNLRRSEEAGLMMRAGANAITKFPATKQFATKKAEIITDLIKHEDRSFISNLTSLPEIDWNKEIDNLQIDRSLKERMKEKLPSYLKVFNNPVDEDKAYSIQ